MSSATFAVAANTLETVLSGKLRAEIVDGLMQCHRFTDALTQLRAGMRANLFIAGFDKIVQDLDTRTRKDGFNVLHDWDGKALTPNVETIPVDILNYFMGLAGDGPPERVPLAILLDYHFLYLLALLSLRVWDHGDPNANMDRVTNLVDALQGPNGSGQRCVGNGEMLMFVATSHFEPDEKVYWRLLERTKQLDERHRIRVALINAGILASHLRFGFEPFYKRDIAFMRNDNAADYPWLCLSLLTLMRAYDNGAGDSDAVVEGILNGLTPDTRAFIGKAPASLAEFAADHEELKQLFHANKEKLLRDFERHRPAPEFYSPLAFSFNFPHNIAKAVIANALARREPSTVTLNDLLTRYPSGDATRAARESFAAMLMSYAKLSPENIKGKLYPIFVYDTFAGLRSFNKTIGLIKE